MRFKPSHASHRETVVEVSKVSIVYSGSRDRPSCIVDPRNEAVDNLSVRSDFFCCRVVDESFLMSNLRNSGSVVDDLRDEDDGPAAEGKNELSPAALLAKGETTCVVIPGFTVLIT